MKTIRYSAFNNNKVQQLFESQLRILFYECKNLDRLLNLSNEQIIHQANIETDDTDRLVILKQIDEFKTAKRIMLKITAEQKRKRLREQLKL